MQLRILPRADRDIDEIILYFVKRKAIRAGQRFLDAVDKSIKLMAQSPTLAASWYSPDPLLEDVRFWNVKGIQKYIIFFRIRNEIVEVMRVLHSSRDLKQLLLRI